MTRPALHPTKAAMDDPVLARLLSQHDEPSVLEREALFERVMAQVEAPRRRRFAGFVAAGGLAAAAAAVLFVRFAEPRDPLAARGLSGHRPHAAIVCTETGLTGHCRAGGTIAFDVQADGSAEYVAAFAVRGDETLWFFPAEGRKGIRLGASGKPELLSQGIHLGEGIRAGDWEVFVVFSPRPLDRDEIKAALGADLSGRSGVEVLRQPFSVEPSP